MALTFNGVGTTSLPSEKKPVGFTDPEVTPVTGTQLWTWVNTIKVDRATVQNANKVTTMGNILDDNTVGLNKVCEDIAGQLENTTNTVAASAELVDIRSNLNALEPGSDFYNDQNDVYECDVIITAKVTEN